jgi:hypothetical protein
MARITKLDEYLANHSAESMMQEWNAGGETRERLIAAIGYANEGALYNALKAAGYIVSAAESTGDKPTRAKSAGKVRGCLPFKTANAIARVLNLDPEIDDIGWPEFKAAYDQQSEPENWLGLLMHRLGGIDSDGGKSLQDWIDSNRAIDAAAAAAAARAADPTIQLKEKVAKLNKMLDEKEREVYELREQLERAKSAQRSSRVNRGGELTEPMLRLLKQRFHPDKQNGNDPVMYNAIMQWLNAIEI